MVQLSILANSRLFREALAARLADEDWVQLISVAGTMYALLLQAEGRPSQVLLVRLDLESAVGAEVVWDIKTLLPATRIVVLGSAENDAEILRWVEAGAMAYLEDDASWAQLVETIQSAAEGRATFSPAVISRAVHRIENLKQAHSGGAVSEQQSLSDREAEVAQLITMRLAQKQVARRLGVKTPTVKSHLSSIYRKLHLRGRRDLM